MLFFFSFFFSNWFSLTFFCLQYQSKSYGRICMKVLGLGHCDGRFNIWIQEFKIKKKKRGFFNIARNFESSFLHKYIFEEYEGPDGEGNVSSVSLFCRMILFQVCRVCLCSGTSAGSGLSYSSYSSYSQFAHDETSYFLNLALRLLGCGATRVFSKTNHLHVMRMIHV